MRVSQAFLPKVNKILVSFVLNLRLFSFFFFIYFICIRFLFYLLVFVLIKAFHCTSGFNFTSADFNRTFLCEFTCRKMHASSRNFGHLVYNQQNCIMFYWYFYTEWKTVAHAPYIYLIDFFKSKLMHCQKDGCYKRYVIK